MDGSRRSRVARGSGTTIQDVNSLLKQFREMQKMMKGMASGNMPNLPGMPNLSGMGGRAAKKLAQQAAGAGLAGPGGRGRAVPASRTSTCSPSSWAAATPTSCRRLSPGWPAPAARPARPRGEQVNKGTKKKKKGGRVTPPKGR